MCTENFASLLGQPGPNDLVRKFRIGPLGNNPDGAVIPVLTRTLTLTLTLTLNPLTLNSLTLTLALTLTLTLTLNLLTL
jgi:hypothetical protein